MGASATNGVYRLFRYLCNPSFCKIVFASGYDQVASENVCKECFV